MEWPKDWSAYRVRGFDTRIPYLRASRFIFFLLICLSDERKVERQRGEIVRALEFPRNTEFIRWNFFSSKLYRIDNPRISSMVDWWVSVYIYMRDLWKYEISCEIIRNTFFVYHFWKVKLIITESRTLKNDQIRRFFAPKRNFLVQFIKIGRALYNR